MTAHSEGLSIRYWASSATKATYLEYAGKRKQEDPSSEPEPLGKLIRNLITRCQFVCRISRHFILIPNMYLCVAHVFLFLRRSIDLS